MTDEITITPCPATARVQCDSFITFVAGKAMVNNMATLWSLLFKMLTAYLTVISFLIPSGVSERVIPMQITVNEKKQIQTIEGWGTSACWWSQNVSDDETRTELAKLLYSKDGLGLNIYRYNVGGGVNPEHNRVWGTWRNTESFYYYNETTGKYEYDFTRDANAQAFLDEALKYGCIDTVVLFANSPHYSMTISGEASGSTQAGGVSNLAPEHYQDFVDYFLTITEYFINKGIPVKYISPINEPQWDWGSDTWVGQEGCHYEPEQVYELLALFSKGIDERGLDVKLSVPDSGEVGGMTETYFNLIANDPELLKNVGSFAYHSYWADNTGILKKADFGKFLSKEPYASMKVEMSEWCELPCERNVHDIASASLMGRIISNDIRYVGVNSWTSWVAVNTVGIGEDGEKYSDGLLWATDDFSEYGFATRYYAYANFTKFVPAGSVVLQSTDNSGVRNYNLELIKDENGDAVGIEGYMKTSYNAFKTPEGKTVVVIVNEDVDKDIKVKVSGALKEVYTTDSEHRLDSIFGGTFNDTVKNELGCTVRVSVAQNSVTTLIFE